MFAWTFMILPGLVLITGGSDLWGGTTSVAELAPHEYISTN